jgi:D-alanine-D-alanine ligase
MGGWSAEREVSLRSGAACADALKSAGYEVTTVDVDKNIAKTLSDARPDIAFNALHGPYGEDGCVQGLLEMLQIPYTHSGVLASALAMNKARARDIFTGASIPVADGMTISRFDAAKKHPMEPPYVIKPVADGSSMGVHIVKKDMSPVAEIASGDWKFGDDVLVEKYVSGRELTCGVMGDRALGVTEIESELKFYNYEAKYAPGGSRHILPAAIPHDIYARIQALALSAHNALGCRGISRADFRFDDTSGELICLEVNTQPGMTETSLFPEMAAHAGLSFPQLADWMAKDASVSR